MNAWRSAYQGMATNGPRSRQDAVMFWGLRPLSFLYGLVVRLRSALYVAGLKKSYRAAVPVLSVGNLTAGGTGKTPMVDFLVRYLVGRGIRCAIVSRGYGGHYQQAVGRVSDGGGLLRMSPGECGDEPYLLASRNPAVPVYVARQRGLGVQAAEQDGAQLILLDDGFQHLAVKRDWDIVLLDAARPFGNGQLLPAGILREPRAALQRADLIVLTRADAGQADLPQSGAPVVRSRHQIDQTLSSLDGTPVAAEHYAGKSALAFAGIAKPLEFFKSLRSFGFGRMEEIPLADHQEYSRETLNRLRLSCHNHDLLVTTEKDAVKLSATDFPKPCYRVGVELVFDDMAPLTELLDKVLEKCR